MRVVAGKGRPQGGGEGHGRRDLVVVGTMVGELGHMATGERRGLHRFVGSP